MIESFGIPENDIAWWAGLTSAIFSLCQGFTSISWGAASDRFGRKPIILIGLVNTMVMMLVWGFSTNLPMAISARALQGLGNGNVGILRTVVAELCPWKVRDSCRNHKLMINISTGITASRVQHHASRVYYWRCFWPGICIFTYLYEYTASNSNRHWAACCQILSR